MSDAFISYSRKNRDFARQLFDHLDQCGKTAWIDWEDIPLSSPNWWNDIKAGIESSDNFVYIMSPDSMASVVCNLELDYAIELHKRIIPILYQEIVSRDAFATIADFEPDDAMEERLSGKDPLIIARDNWHQLSHINWVFFRQEDDFDTSFARLLETIETDLAYVKAHTRYLTRATEWECADEREDLLLFGEEIDRAEAWLEQADDYATPTDPEEPQIANPLPQELHRRYIQASRAAADRRKAQLKELESSRARARQALRRVISIGSAVIATAVLIVAGATAIQRITESNAIAEARGEMVQLPGFSTRLESGESVAFPAFAIHRYEVSNAQYRLCDQFGPCEPPVHDWPSGSGLDYDYATAPDDYPVQSVTADEAAQFCKWIGGRLPTAFEWQFAARGEEQRLFPWGDELPDQSTVRVNMYVEGADGGVDHPVAVDDAAYSGSASADGAIMHLLGNVREWTGTTDACDGLCTTPWELGQNITGSLQLMGHSYVTGSLSGRVLRTAPDEILFDDLADPQTPDETVGFRCVQPL